MLVYQLRRLVLINNFSLSRDELDESLSYSKTQIYRVVCLVIFVTYPWTREAILHLLSCQEICSTGQRDSCQYFLRADFTVQCFTNQYNKYIIVSLHIACFVHSLFGGYPIPAMEVLLQKDLSRRANQKLPWKRNIHWSQLPLWKLFPKVLVLGTHRSFEKGLADFDGFSSWSRNAKPSWRSSDYVRNLLHSGSLLQAHQW